MHEILENLGPGKRVLDIGSGPGSFPSSMGPFIAIRADLDRPSVPVQNFAQSDAAHLPFRDHAFDAVISNHSLEHFHDLAGALAEMGRVLKPTGALFIAVPYGALPQIGKDYGASLNGKVMLDACNAVAARVTTRQRSKPGRYFVLKIKVMGGDIFLFVYMTIRYFLS